ncbi:4'-phosphopantetheinyl transferase family protein [Bradyrhizobium murdochi]|uniref:4'-phosphopantetheinyl transferase family protein n=1 Tax=Bradyrhizobium murdochi TaxID=1038859 RepID=UPI0018DD9680|nr:4'-phosphopantetheinyl transferase superfamily protein [Bradyrhizobium murdochi]
MRWLGDADITRPVGRLELEEIVLWLAATPPSREIAAGEPGMLSVERAAKVLDADETDRMGRFLHIEDRMSYLAAHAGVRLMLGGLVGQPAEALRFQPSEHGKPMLVAGPVEIDFSLSHARGSVAVAAARMPIGVDIEPLREIADMDSVAEIVLAAEEREVLRNAPAALRPQLFLRYWTIKEALLKAAALGFTIAPNTVIVDAGPSPAVLSAPAALGSAEEWLLIAPAI